MGPKALKVPLLMTKHGTDLGLKLSLMTRSDDSERAIKTGKKSNYANLVGDF